MFFFSAEITCTADVLHSYLVFSIGTRFVDPSFYFITFVGRFHYSTLFIMKTSNKSDEIKKKKEKKRRDSQIGYLCKKYGSAGRFTIFGTYVFKSNLEHFWQKSRWSPVYVPEIETGRHVKNNACTVEIKIKWMIRKHMTSENIYWDDTI